MNSADKQAVLHCLKSMIDEEVCEECPLYGITGTDHCEKDCVRLAINALSSAENPNKWIPCSERLPEYNTPILLALKQIGKERTIVIGERRTRKSGWYFVDIAAYDTEHEVMAWMPLPEPYTASPTGAERSDKE